MFLIVIEDTTGLGWNTFARGRNYWVWQGAMQLRVDGSTSIDIDDDVVGVK